MANFKPVIGFDDNLSNHLQNYAPTAYAVSKMRAGRTPKDVSGTTIIDANAIFRPGLYYMDTGSINLNNEGTASTYPVYLYNLVQDPDESLKGGHKLADDTNPTWHLNVPMNFRQILYACNSQITGVVTRIGVRDPAVDSQRAGTYKVIATVQRIESTLKSLSPTGSTPNYAYVCDIAMWIKYYITNSITTGNVVTWVPAIQWDVWKSITGDSPVEAIKETDAAAKDLTANTRYVVFGQHQLTLPDANACTVGSKIVVDQWKGTSVVRAYNSDKSTLISEMDVSPCVANAGMSDMNIHSDEDVAPEGVTFTRNVNQTWSYTNGSTTYTVELVTLKPNSSSEDGKVRWAVTFMQDGVKYLKRVTPDEATYPFDATPVYYQTSDTAIVAGKAYYEKSVVSGQVVYTLVHRATGAIITDELYEMSPSLRWYDVADYTTHPTTYKQPTDIAQSEITYSGILKTLTFTVTDVTGNIVGAGQYTFEVTYDSTTTANKIWVLERCSDFEALMNKVTTNIGATVTAQGETISNHEGRIEANEQLILQYRNQYFLKDYPVRITVENLIYGDNAKVSGEDLIVFDEGEFLDRGSLTATSYIVNYFRSRLTPVYTVATQNGDMHTFYLPTKMKAIVGKQIKFLLEPNAKITVLDDNSSLTPTSYLFEGYHESTSVISDHPKMTEVIFEVVAYKNQSGTESYAWTYMQRLSNSNNSITTQDISDAVSAHDRNSSCHSGFFVTPTVFSSHTADAVIHLTAAERFRWERMAASGATSQAVSNIGSSLISAHNIDSDAHPDKITNGQLTSRLQGYITATKLTEVLSDYVTTVTLDVKLSSYMTTSAGTTMSNTLVNQINSRVTSSAMTSYVDARITSIGSDYITSSALSAALLNYVTKTSFDVLSADVTTKTNASQVSAIVSSMISNVVTSDTLTATLQNYVTSANVSALVSQILNEELTSRTF